MGLAFDLDEDSDSELHGRSFSKARTVTGPLPYHVLSLLLQNKHHGRFSMQSVLCSVLLSHIFNFS